MLCMISLHRLWILLRKLWEQCLLLCVVMLNKESNASRCALTIVLKIGAMLICVVVCGSPGIVDDEVKPAIASQLGQYSWNWTQIDTHQAIAHDHGRVGVAYSPCATYKLPPKKIGSSRAVTRQDPAYDLTKPHSGIPEDPFFYGGSL
jgi:hypothetical protein